ncbi:MAG: universal stress protein [Prolixibacteraceae bacterium]|nr:universal stress protein [Prolixibacteraceae bacterium]
MMYRSNNILALVPPDEDGQLILKQTLFIQKSLGMNIFILNVIKEPSFFNTLFRPRKLSYKRNEALNELKKFVENFVDGEIPRYMALRVKSGNTLRILFLQSKNGGYEFMIVDKSESPGGLSRYETDKLISRSVCPVMTINKDHFTDNFKKIIIPVDISRATSKKLLWATYFAKKFNAKIEIVSALNVNLSTRNSLAWKNAEKLKYMLIKRGVECEVTVLKTQIREKHKVIIEHIEKEKPGLVIIRTHEESNMTGTAIGKFVSEIVHECKMPVFTVNRLINPMPVDFEY